MFSDRPSRVHGRAVVHTEGEKRAVRVQKEAPVHTEGEGGRRRQSKKRCGREGQFLRNALI